MLTPSQKLQSVIVIDGPCDDKILFCPYIGHDGYDTKEQAEEALAKLKIDQPGVTGEVMSARDYFVNILKRPDMV